MGRPTHRPRSKSARESLQERKRGERARLGSYLMQTLPFSYAAISTRVYPSHPNREYKLVRARVVLRWGTTREGPVLRFFFRFAEGVLSFEEDRFILHFRPFLSFVVAQPCTDLPDKTTTVILMVRRTKKR